MNSTEKIYHTTKKEKNVAIKKDTEENFRSAEKQYIKYNAFTKKNNETKNLILRRLVEKCQKISHGNDEFYKINDDVGSQQNKLLDTLSRDRHFKNTMSGVVFRELMSTGKGIHLDKLNEETEALRTFLYTRKNYKDSIEFYMSFIKFWRDKVKEIELTTELNQDICNYFRLLLIEGAAFNSHDAHNISCIIDWFINVKYGYKLEQKGIENILLNKIKRYFEDQNIEFPMVIYKE